MLRPIIHSHHTNATDSSSSGGENGRGMYSASRLRHVVVEKKGKKEGDKVENEEENEVEGGEEVRWEMGREENQRVAKGNGDGSNVDDVSEKGMVVSPSSLLSIAPATTPAQAQATVSTMPARAETCVVTVTPLPAVASSPSVPAAAMIPRILGLSHGNSFA